jgi:D-sedoheptulose 7-phosphate isomerase
MKAWLEKYLKDQIRITASLPVAEIQEWILLLKAAREKGGHLFTCGNGGSAANSSHFAVDLGKGASRQKKSKDLSARFRVMSLTDNVPWMTALGNDYSYEEVFVEQLKNYAKKGDILIVVTVSGNSPNIVKSVEWAKKEGLVTLGLVGSKKGNKISKLAQRVISIPSEHYGRVEDAQMNILHLLCYAFIEGVA